MWRHSAQIRAHTQGPGPGPWAWARVPGPGPWAWGVGQKSKSKIDLRLKKNIRDVRYARIDPSRRGVMTGAIFVLPEFTRDHKMTKNRGKPRKSVKIRFFLYKEDPKEANISL